jgi:hypothetical protein
LQARQEVQAQSGIDVALSGIDGTQTQGAVVVLNGFAPPAAKRGTLCEWFRYRTGFSPEFRGRAGRCRRRGRRRPLAFAADRVVNQENRRHQRKDPQNGHFARRGAKLHSEDLRV